MLVLRPNKQILKHLSWKHIYGNDLDICSVVNTTVYRYMLIQFLSVVNEQNLWRPGRQFNVKSGECQARNWLRPAWTHSFGKVNDLSPPPPPSNILRNFQYRYRYWFSFRCFGYVLIFYGSGTKSEYFSGNWEFFLTFCELWQLQYFFFL